MKDFTRYLARTAIFLVILGLELLSAAQFIPHFSDKEIHDFMLISMGMAFIPLFLVLIIAAVVFGLFAFVAGFIATAATRRKVSIGQAWQRKGGQTGKPDGPWAG
jgi:hypothetical protein